MAEVKANQLLDRNAPTGERWVRRFDDDTIVIGGAWQMVCNGAF